MRVPKGVNSRGLFAIIRRCVGVVSLRGAGCLLLDVGVAEVNFLRFLGVAVSPSSSSGITNSSKSPGVVALVVDLRLRVRTV